MREIHVCGRCGASLRWWQWSGCRPCIDALLREKWGKWV